MTLTKAKEVVAKLLEDFPQLEAVLDGAPSDTSVQKKLEKCVLFAAKVLPRERAREVKKAALTIDHRLEIGSCN